MTPATGGVAFGTVGHALARPRKPRVSARRATPSLMDERRPCTASHHPTQALPRPL